MLENFHFLRPLWLLALVPIATLFMVVRYFGDDTRQWRRMIAPHLLAHLRVPATGRALIRPIHLFTLITALCAVAASGPSWERETSPFAEDVAPLVIALDLSQSMNAVDIQPTRLERGKQKIADLLDGRKGARTALVAYAGSAHVVLPLCDDPSVFEPFLSVLENNLMPVEGRNVGAAVAVAETLLAGSEFPGTILFVTDGVGTGRDVLVRSAIESRHSVAILAVGTSRGGSVRNSDGSFATGPGGRRIIARLEREELEALGRDAGIAVIGVTADTKDVALIERRIESNLLAAQQDDATMRWKDNGYYLVFPAVLLLLFWFRRGWVVQWGAAVFVVMLTGCAGDMSGTFDDLWWTKDQQGRLLFEQNRPAEAAERFVDPMWKGIAAYRAGDFDLAIESFSLVDTPESYFNQGNALAHLGSLEDAVAAYDAALAERSDWPEATANRDLVASLIPVEPEEKDGQEGGDPAFDPDQIEFDEKGKKGKKGDVAQSAFSEEQIAEMWMRRLQVSPGAYLKSRFAVEADKSGARDGGGP